jgi:hypothetical protein
MQKIALLGARPAGRWAPGNLLVIADATSQIADLGCETHLRRLGFVRTRSYKHVANLSDLTFRLLIGVIQFLTKRLAIGVLLGPGVHPNQLLGIGVAEGNNFAVTDVGAKHV